MDNFMGNTIIGFASREREQIKIRTNIGKRQHAKNNQRTASFIPFGYVKNPKTKQLEINEEEKAIILRVIKNYLEDNMTLQAIGKQMKKELKEEIKSFFDNASYDELKELVGSCGG